MAKGCCGGANCGCRIQDGTDVRGNRSIRVSGVGSATDPVIIRGAAIEEVDTADIDLVISYDAGTNKYIVSAQFATTSKLDALGDVVAGAPTANQVLGWDSASAKWTPRAPTSAAVGSVNHDNSLAGDGSAGASLTVRHSATGSYTVTRTDGVGLSDEGVNSLVRRFNTAADRLAATPAPDINTLSITEDNPGQVDYWTGSTWETLVILIGEDGDELHALSGAYVPNSPTSAINVMVDAITDSEGRITVLDGNLEPMASAGGILDYNFELEMGFPFITTYAFDEGNLDLIVYTVDVSGFVPAASVQVRGKLRAVLY